MLGCRNHEAVAVQQLIFTPAKFSVCSKIAINLVNYRNYRTLLLLVAFNNTSQARLLPRGHNVIRPDRQVEGPTCGVVPMNGPVTATSTGEK